MSFYEQFVRFEKVSGQQAYACCPLHPDTNASFTVNQETDEWYCHGCEKGGKYAEFLMYYYDIGRDIAIQAVKAYEAHKPLPFPTEEYVEKSIARLKARPSEIEVLNGFGITQATIDKYKLGWDDTRITIPIYSKTGQLVNVRKYLPPHRRVEGSNNSKVIGVRGCNETRYYPYDSLTVDKSEVWIVEGEKDCLAAISQGINAVTGTGGSNIPERDLELFKDKVVNIMVDTDATGNRVQTQYLHALDGVAKQINLVKLPVKDFVEYWEAYHDANIRQYTTLGVKVENVPVKEALEESTTLFKSEYVENLNTWVKLENMCVIGADPKTYTVPNKFKICCSDTRCDHPCKVKLSKDGIELAIDPRQLLEFVDSSDMVQDKYLQYICGCKHIKATPTSFTNVQKIIFQESASFIDGLAEASFEPRYGIFLYEEARLTPTVKYNFIACRVTDPRNQKNYYVIRQAESIQQYAEKFDASCLDYFHQLDAASNNVHQLIDAHYKQWESTVGIEQRADLFGALLLTYLSVTEIEWRGGTIKGWLDTMVIGDTRTGKSQMAQRFVKAFELGSYINGENARGTGVIGGVQRYNDSWIITWGAIPMNDRGMLIIDEASGLEIEEIKELSSTRSSGAVTINKIAKGEARARTRLLWLSNPRSGRNLEDFFWKGYGAFTEFIPVVEDQARYDLVLTAARDDVVLVGQLRQGNLDITQYRELVGFAWNVSKNGVQFSKPAIDKVITYVAQLSKDFEGGPLVVGVAVHEKLLRISSAVAVLRGTIVDDVLKVDEKSVDYAYDFLYSTLSKPTFDYKGFIEESKRAVRAKDQNMQYIRALISMHPALKVLLSANRFKGGQISEILGVDRTEAAKIISDLLRRGLMQISYNGAYQPDKLLVDIARQMEI